MKCENTKFAKEKVKIAVLSQGYSWNKNGVTFGTKWYGKIKIAVCNLGFSKMYLNGCLECSPGNETRKTSQYNN